MNRISIGLPAAAMALAALAGCASGESSSMSPIELASAATAQGAAPMYLVAPGGERILSWVGEDGETGHGQLVIEVTAADGGVPRRAVIADPLGGVEPHGEAPPQLAASPDGALYALYTVGKEVPGERFPRSALRFVRSDDAGTTWSEPVNVNEGERFGSHNFHAVLAGPGGAVYAAWLSSNRGRSAVWLRRSGDGGRSWTPAAAIDTTEACPCCRTGLALGPDGSLYVSWRKVFADGVRDVVVMRSPDGGETWNAPVRPREDGWVIAACPHAGPSLAVDADGTVHVAWWTGREGSAGVYYASSNDGGASYRPMPIAVGERSAPAHVRVLSLGGRGVAVAWDDGLGQTPRVLLRAASDGRGFSETIEVSRGGAASFPVLGLAGDSLLIAWSQQGAEAHEHMIAARPDMSDPKAVMSMPRVGQLEIFTRRIALTGILGGPAGP